MEKASRGVHAKPTEVGPSFDNKKCKGKGRRTKKKPLKYEAGLPLPLPRKEIEYEEIHSYSDSVVEEIHSESDSSSKQQSDSVAEEIHSESDSSSNQQSKQMLDHEPEDRQTEKGSAGSSKMELRLDKKPTTVESEASETGSDCDYSDDVDSDSFFDKQMMKLEYLMKQSKDFKSEYMKESTQIPANLDNEQDKEPETEKLIEELTPKIIKVKCSHRILPYRNFICVRTLRLGTHSLKGNWYALDLDPTSFLRFYKFQTLSSSLSDPDHSDSPADESDSDDGEHISIETKFIKQFRVPFPKLPGFAVCNNNLFMLGGHSNGPLDTVYMFNHGCFRWDQRRSMRQARVNPVVIVSEYRIYVFGRSEYIFGYRELEPSAEYCNVMSDVWWPIYDLPQGLLLTQGTEKRKVLCHAVVDTRIILWNSESFFLFDPDAARGERWTVYPLGRPIYNVINVMATGMDGVLYCLCGDSVFAYDLAGKKLFPGPLFSVSHSLKPYNLFATNKGELCFIWHHSYNYETRESKFVCGKVEIEKSSGPEDGEIILSVGKSHFEYFALEGSISHSLCFARSRRIDDKIFQISNPESLLKNLYMLMRSQAPTISEYAEEIVRVELSAKKSQVSNSDSSGKKLLELGGRPLDDFLASLGYERYVCCLNDHLKKCEVFDMSALEYFESTELRGLGIPMGPRLRIMHTLRMTGDRLVPSTAHSEIKGGQLPPATAHSEIF